MQRDYSGEVCGKALFHIDKVSLSVTRLQTERAQILEDLQAVERAFNDLHRKYERTKEVVAGFKSNEDVLKRTVEDLTIRFAAGISNRCKSRFFPGTRREKRGTRC